MWSCVSVSCRRLPLAIMDSHFDCMRCALADGCRRIPDHVPPTSAQLQPHHPEGTTHHPSRITCCQPARLPVRHLRRRGPRMAAAGYCILPGVGRCVDWSSAGASGLTLRAGALSLASCMCNGCNVLQDSHAVVSEPPPVSSSVSRAPAGAAARSRGAACGRGVACLLSRHYHVLRGEVRPCARRGGAAAADRPAASAVQPGVLEDAGAHLLFSRLLAFGDVCA